MEEKPIRHTEGLMHNENTTSSRNPGAFQTLRHQKLARKRAKKECEKYCKSESERKAGESRALPRVSPAIRKVETEYAEGRHS
jgi:hypothetical protein